MRAACGRVSAEVESLEPNGPEADVPHSSLVDVKSDVVQLTVGVRKVDIV
jgi:hypothetical protein